MISCFSPFVWQAGPGSEASSARPALLHADSPPRSDQEADPLQDHAVVTPGHFSKLCVCGLERRDTVFYSMDTHRSLCSSVLCVFSSSRGSHRLVTVFARWTKSCGYLLSSLWTENYPETVYRWTEEVTPA